VTRETDLRTELIESVAALCTEGLLDWTGGALSLRYQQHSMLITPSGSARALWRIQESDLLVVNLDNHHRQPNQPASLAMHALIYNNVPEIHAIFHSHAGAMYTASCIAKGELGVLPPTVKMGSVPVIGEGGVRGVNCSEGNQGAEALRDSSAAAVRCQLPLWLNRDNWPWFAFLDREHGVFVMAKTSMAALVGLAKLESGARLWLEERRISSASLSI